MLHIAPDKPQVSSSFKLLFSSRSTFPSLIQILLLTLLLFTEPINTYLTATDLQYPEQLKKLCDEAGLVFFQHVLERTVKGNHVVMYGIASKQHQNIQGSDNKEHVNINSNSNKDINNDNINGNSNIKDNKIVNSNTKSYQPYLNSHAILLTSVMHPRQYTSFLFIKQVLQNIIKQYKQNNENLKYIMERVVILVIPFVNIDAVKYTIERQLSQKQIQEYRKNMNYNDTTTTTTTNGKQCDKIYNKGVDINRNFPYNFNTQKSSNHPCSQQFHGSYPFSQSQSKSISQLFASYKILINFDIHSYGNIWIYPYASSQNQNKIQEENIQMYQKYQYAFDVLQQRKIKYANCYRSLGYLADGVYIDWALEMGSLSFAVQVGEGFNNVGNKEEFGRNVEGVRGVMGICGGLGNFQVYFQVQRGGQGEQGKEKKIRTQQNKQEKNNLNVNVKLCFKSLSILEHNLILVINQTLIQGRRSHPNNKSCFNHNFTPFVQIQAKDSSSSQLKYSLVNNLPQVKLKLGKSNLAQKINLSELKFKQKKANQQEISSMSIFFVMLKNFLIVFGILCFIGSLCGLSICCQKALNSKMHEQQGRRLAEQQHSTEHADSNQKIQNQRQIMTESKVSLEESERNRENQMKEIQEQENQDDRRQQN